MLTLIFGIWASDPPRPGERLKRPGLIGLSFFSGSRDPYGPDLPSLCGRKFHFSLIGLFSFLIRKFQSFEDYSTSDRRKLHTGKAIQWRVGFMLNIEKYFDLPNDFRDFGQI